MNNNLVMITRRFPYNKTEAYIETEIKYTSKIFKEILILPSETFETIRDTPHNVLVNNSLSKCFNHKIYRSIKTLFNLFFWKTLYLHFKKIQSISDIKIIFKFSTGVLTYYRFFKANTSILNNKVVYTYWFNEATYALIKLKEKNNFTYKVVTRAHRFDLYEGFKDTYNFWPYRSQIINKIDKIFVISNNGKEFLESKYPNISNIKISRLGILNNYNISNYNNNNLIKIVSASRITKIKRVELIYTSLLTYAKNNSTKNIIWSHFGDGEMKKELELKINTEKISNLKVELKGQVNNSIIYEYYNNNNIDLFLNLSSSEGIPVSIMEAQSFGIPVIATDVGGTKEIVNENVGFLLSENPSIDNINSAIENLFQKNISHKDIKTYWNKNFNADINYNNFSLDLYNL